MATSDAALRAVIANAMRHLIEADQHYKAGRYPSAETSAIFSIEETGKLGFLTATGSAVKAKKHATYAIPFLGITGVISMWPRMAEWREVLRGGKASTASLTAAQRQIVAEHPEFAEFMRRVEAGELEDAAERHVALAGAVLARQHKDRGVKSFWDTVLREGLQAARLKATYVEVTDLRGRWCEFRAQPKRVPSLAANRVELPFGCLDDALQPRDKMLHIESALPE